MSNTIKWLAWITSRLNPGVLTHDISQYIQYTSDKVGSKAFCHTPMTPELINPSGGHNLSALAKGTLAGTC